MLIKKYRKNDENDGEIGGNDRNGSERAQSVLEYLALMTIVTIVLFSMSTYFQRGVQGMMKIAADQIGNQEEGDQRAGLTNTGTIRDPKMGFLVESYSAAQTISKKSKMERIGTFNSVYDDTFIVISNAVFNQGFVGPE